MRILKSLTSPARLGNEIYCNDTRAGWILRKLVETRINVSLPSETRKNVLFTGINHNCTIFAVLFAKMNDYGGDNNFTAMINQLFALWLLSDYSFIRPHEINYTSIKSFGFYFTNYDFYFEDDTTQIVVAPASLTPEAIIASAQNKTLSLNTFAPVALTSGTQVEVAEQDTVSDWMPAFYLKAIDDKNAVANLETGLFLAVDIISTFTGFGNLLKFRSLFKSLQLTYEGLNTIKILAASKIIIASIEITSGVVGTMLTLSNECSSKFCNAIRNCLFYMELFDLGADVIVSKLLKKSAQKALDVKAFTPNKGVDQVQYEEMIKTFEELAEVKVNALKSIKKIKFIYRGFSKKFDDHLNRGQITIKKKNAQNGDIDLAESYDYATGLGGKEPSAFVPPWQAKVNVSGVHRYTNIDNKLIKINKVEDVKKLPTGEVVEILRIEIFVKELNKFVKKKDISTMWPKNWSMQTIKRVTKEASQNVIWNDRSSFIGISSEGLQIQFFSTNTGIIDNAFLNFDKL